MVGTALRAFAHPTKLRPLCRHDTPHGHHRHRQRDQHIVSGEREAEEAPLHLIATDHFYAVETLQQRAGAAEIDDRPGAIGRPLPELPFDAGVIAAQPGIGESSEREDGEPG